LLSLDRPLKGEKPADLPVQHRPNHSGGIATYFRSNEMTSFLRVATLVGLLAGGLAIVSPGLKAGQASNIVRERQAVITELSPNAKAITYWVVASEGWQVVTTIDTVFNQDSDAEQHAVVRFSAVLLPGQSQLISVPFAIGEQQQVLRIRRVADQIEVARIPG